MLESRDRVKIKLFNSWAEFGILITSLCTFAATMGILFHSIPELNISIGGVQKSLEAQNFTITYPSNNSSVNYVELIQGKTPFSQLNHYIVVTPMRTGEDWVMGDKANVYSGVTWTGRAQFGTGSVGIGEQFMVRALATKSTLSGGPLTKVPEDAVFSQPVVVTRQK